MNVDVRENFSFPNESFGQKNYKEHPPLSSVPDLFWRPKTKNCLGNIQKTVRYLLSCCAILIMALRISSTELASFCSAGVSTLNSASQAVTILAARSWGSASTMACAICSLLSTGLIWNPDLPATSSSALRASKGSLSFSKASPCFSSLSCSPARSPSLIIPSSSSAQSRPSRVVNSNLVSAVGPLEI